MNERKLNGEKNRRRRGRSDKMDKRGRNITEK